VLYVWLRVEQVEGGLETYESVLQGADCVTDGLQRLVHSGNVSDHNQHLADSQMALDYVISAQAQHDGGTHRGDHIDDQREERLLHSHFHSRSHRTGGLFAKPAMLVLFAAKGHDDPDHGKALVYYSQRFSLEAHDPLQPALNVRGVVAD